MGSHFCGRKWAMTMKNPQFLKAARLVRFTIMAGPLRDVAIRFIQARSRNVPLETCDKSIFPDLDLAAMADRLERDGYTPGLRLPRDLVDTLQAFYSDSTPTPYSNPHVSCPAMRAVTHDPNLVALARLYLGVEPILHSTHIWRTRAGSWNKHGNRFHFDVADFKSLVVFFYLSDVGPGSGPHVVIKGTQRRKSFPQLLNPYKSDEEAASRFGDRVELVLGPKGTGFCEEQTIFHKALPPLSARLTFAIIYTLRRPPKWRKAPLSPEENRSVSE